MRTYRRASGDLGAPRAHPWTNAAGDSGARYHDFKTRPQLVRTSLEDFAPWNGYAAVETFYRIVEWINGPGIVLESNDCAFAGPHDNPDVEFRKALECTGRLMILYRDLRLNLSRPRVERLESALLHVLSAADPEFAWGAVGTTIVRTEYVGLPAPEAGRIGYQLMLSFWAWGDTADETMASLDRLLGNLSRALHEASAG